MKSFKEIKNQINELVNDNFEGFIKALISYEFETDDEECIQYLYYRYMEDDTVPSLLADRFLDFIDDWKRLNERTSSKDSELSSIFTNEVIGKNYSEISDELI